VIVKPFSTGEGQGFVNDFPLRAACDWRFNSRAVSSKADLLFLDRDIPCLRG